MRSMNALKQSKRENVEIEERFQMRKKHMQVGIGVAHIWCPPLASSSLAIAFLNLEVG